MQEMFTIVRYTKQIRAHALMSKLEAAGIACCVNHFKTTGVDTLCVKVDYKEASNAIIIYEAYEKEYLSNSTIRLNTISNKLTNTLTSIPSHTV